jgi:hypothetical protein
LGRRESAPSFTTGTERAGYHGNTLLVKIFVKHFMAFTPCLFCNFHQLVWIGISSRGIFLMAM